MTVRNVGQPVARPPKPHTVAHSAAAEGRQRGRNARKVVANTGWVKFAYAAGAVAVGGVALYYYLASQNPVSLRRPLTVFPEHTARHMYTGIQLVADGALGCAFGDHNALPFPKAVCEAKAIQIDQALQAQGMKACTPEHYQGGGFFAETHAGRFLTCLDPKKLIDYEEALEIAEKEVLSKPGFFEKPAEEIAGFFKGIHRLIMQSEPNKLPGSYRKETAFVFDGSIQVNADPNTVSQAFRKAGATESQIQTLIGAARKSYDEFTSEERSVYELVGYFPPAGTEVPAMMNSFYTNLKAQVAKCTDPIDLAADPHCKQSHIHAFNDGNGRVARFLMNLLLAFFKQPTLIFPDDKSYMAAVIADTKAPGSFATYLKQVVIPWNRKLQDP